MKLIWFVSFIRARKNAEAALVQEPFVWYPPPRNETYHVSDTTWKSQTPRNNFPKSEVKFRDFVLFIFAGLSLRRYVWDTISVYWMSPAMELPLRFVAFGPSFLLRDLTTVINLSSLVLWEIDYLISRSVGCWWVSMYPETASQYQIHSLVR